MQKVGRRVLRIVLTIRIQTAIHCTRNVNCRLRFHQPEDPPYWLHLAVDNIITVVFIYEWAPLVCYHLTLSLSTIPSSLFVYFPFL